MTVQWTVRAANDRSAQFARDRIVSLGPKAEPLGSAFFDAIRSRSGSE